MALKLLMMAYVLCTIFHFELIDAAGGPVAISALSQSVYGVYMNNAIANGNRALASFQPNTSFGGKPSSVGFPNRKSFKSKQQPLLHMQHLAPPKAIPRDDFGHGEDKEPHQELTAERAKKEWLYNNTMSKIHEEQDKMWVHILFSEKLAAKKGIDREQRMRNPNWFYRIHYMEMPLNDVMVALAETLVQFSDGKVDVNDYLHVEIKQNADFMEAIENAKVKFAEEKEQAQKRINDNFKALEKRSMQRKSLSKPVYEQLNMNKIHNLWLYQNTMAMFRQDQEGKINEILAEKLSADVDQHNLQKIAHNIFEVALAETFVEYLSDVGNIQDFSATNFSIYMIVKFMADNGLGSQKQQQKFMESFLHLYQENAHMQIDAKLEAAFVHYKSQEHGPHNS